MVKDHQRQLRADIEQVFAMVPWGDRQVCTTTIDLGHGTLPKPVVRWQGSLNALWLSLASKWKTE
jgi:hypothetical protein